MTLMRSAGSSPAGSYGPFTPEALADPAAAHRYLREHCPVHHFDGFGERGFYTVSRHADVDRLFRDVSLWSSEWGQGPICNREGGLRYDPPVLGLFRTSTHPTSLHGVQIPPDSKVHGLYASANRDPAAWDDPDTFRLDRDYDDLRRRQLSFGVGLYLCPGAALARREARVALDLLIDRLPGLRLTGQPERTDSFMMWGPKSLRVAWDVPVTGGHS